jgi:hypothetical protein
VGFHGIGHKVEQRLPAITCGFDRFDQPPERKRTALIVHRFDQAISFAQRAQVKLKENGREWQRANDIISISQSEMANSPRGR